MERHSTHRLPSRPHALTLSVGAWALLLAGCPAQEVPDIVVFAASPETVEEGGTTTLSWEVEGADDIEIRGQPGNFLLSKVSAKGSKISNELAETTLFTLVAMNDKGPSAAAVSVMVPKAATPTVHLFTATPPSVRPGGAVVLAWETSNATSVDVAPGVLTTGNPDGMVTVNPDSTTTYRLTAVSPEGTASAEVVVTVTAEAPIILDFAAALDPIPLSATTTLTWEASGADSLRILEGETELLATTENLGSLPVTPSATVTRYTLEAINAGGVTTSEVEVHAHPPATIDQVGASPVVNGMVTISWSVSNAAELRLLADGAPVAGAGFDVNPAVRDDAGSAVVTVTASTTFRLEVSSAGGDDFAEFTVANQVREIEPNDDEATATLIPVDGSLIIGAVDPVDDEDWFLAPVPFGGNLAAAIADDTTGGCTLAARIEIYESGGVQPIAEAEGPCASVSAFDDLDLLDLDQIFYFVRVTATTIGPYALEVVAEPPGCSNMLVEAGEQCDDGNLTPGDGCDAACLFEQLSLGTLPSPTPLVAADSIAGAEHDAFLLTVTATVYLRAETFAPNQAAGCLTNNDTILALLDSTMNELGRNDDGGDGACSLIDVVERFALLVPGTYFLDVSTFKGNPVPAYELVVSSAPYLVCSNRVLEPGEECDDGNNTDGDGCNATCRFEGLVVSETEPNDVIAGSNSTGLGGVDFGVMQGNASTTTSDLDYWSFVVPVNTQLTMTARVHTMLGDPFSCDNGFDPFVELHDSSDSFLAFNDDDRTTCSVLQTVVAAGASPETYHLVVGVPLPGSEIYFLTVSLQ